MQPATLSNVLSYCAQIACVAAVAGTLPALFRLRAPGVRYAYWRGVVLLCLLLPWVQGRHIADEASPPIAAVTPMMVSVTTTLASPAAISPAGWQFDWDWAVAAAFVLAAGAVIRLLWIAAGLFYLRRLRTAGYHTTTDETHADLQRTLGTRAEIRTIPGLRQPVTFGVIRPVVLLPDTLTEHSSDVQRAVIAHELWHVRRRDWAWILGEEFIRAVFWFHPVMWWLISRVQLSREEVVDELSVLATGRRRTYAEALLAFADSTPLAPAPAFARRRQLLHRIALISTEVIMSSRRIVASTAVMTCVVVAGTWSAIGAFPLQQSTRATPGPLAPSGTRVPQEFKAGPLEQRAKRITPENPIPRRLSAPEPDYPPEAAVMQARGTVTVLITLDELGRVAEARPTAVSVRTEGASSDVRVSFNNRTSTDMTGVRDPHATLEMINALTRSAVNAARQWRYDPPADAPISFAVVFAFHSEPPAASTGTMRAIPQVGDTSQTPRPASDASAWTDDGALRVGGAIKPPTKVRHVPPVYPPIAMSARVAGVVIIETRLEADGHVGSARVVKSIPLLDQAALDAVYQWKFTPTLVNGIPTPVIMTVTVNFTLDQGVSGDSSSVADGAIRIGGDIPPPKKIKHVSPIYPPDAQANHVTGVVIIEARVEADGTISRTLVLKSIPQLDDAAQDAVRQWVFEPTLLNGQPTPVMMTVTVNFTLD